MAARVRFYLNENVQVAIAEQLRRRGIEVVTVRDLGLLGDEGVTHLARATEIGYVFCTHDADYVDLAASRQKHKRTVGEWVAFLELIHGVYDAEEMHNLVEYVKPL